MARDVAEAAKSLMSADDAWLLEVAHRDPDMIRDVAAALHNRITPKVTRWHNGDCELRGNGPCYCDQDRALLRGGPGKDYWCIQPETVECAMWECQELGRCQHAPEPPRPQPAGDPAPLRRSAKIKKRAHP